MITHTIVDQRLRTLVTACLDKMSADLSLIDRAKNSLGRWPEGKRKDEWTGLLALPLPELRRRVLEETENAARLRQDAPFGGMLTPKERMEILKRYRP